MREVALLSGAPQSTINTLWIGTTLGLVERLSIASFLQSGHAVVLYVYNDVAEVPEGITVADAGSILPWPHVSKMRYHKNRSSLLISDYFRMELQRLGRGYWSDLDVICLRPFDFESADVFGLEDEGYINTAVLRLSAKSPILADMLEAIEQRREPDWRDNPERFRNAVRRKFGWPHRPRWGAYGPWGFTHLARRHDVSKLALPQDVLYPYLPKVARAMYAPHSSMDEFITERTRSVHLYSQMLRELRHTRPPATSAIGGLVRRFGL